MPATRSKSDRKAVAEMAQERAATWRKLSPSEQLTIIAKRRGNSTRERARIQARIDAAKPQPKAEEPAKPHVHKTKAERDAEKTKNKG